jgi:hypothetical protein
VIKRIRRETPRCPGYAAAFDEGDIAPLVVVAPDTAADADT